MLGRAQDSQVSFSLPSWVIILIDAPNSLVASILMYFGADDEIRTRDLILTMDALYQLSYVGDLPAFKR